MRMNRADIEQTICLIMMNDGPDGHVDGSDVITDFIMAVKDGRGESWAHDYRTELATRPELGPPPGFGLHPQTLPDVPKKGDRVAMIFPGKGVKVGKVMKTERVEFPIPAWGKYDIEMRSDMNGDSEETLKPVYFLHEIDDPSVGICGGDVSPSFGTVDEVYRWWDRNWKEVTEEADKDEPDFTRFTKE